MRCPQCKCWAVQTKKSMKKEYTQINKRILICPECLYTFSTTEIIDEINLAKKILQDNKTYQLFERETELKNAKKK